MKRKFLFKINILHGLIGLSLLGVSSFSWGIDLKALEKSTLDFVNLNQTVKHKKLSTSELARWIEIAKVRREQLEEGINTNPNTFARFIIPKNESLFLPKEIKPYIEQEVTNIKGTLELRISTDKQFDKEYIEYVLHGKDGEIYYLHFTTKPSEHLITGTLLTVKKGYQLHRHDKVNDVLVMPNALKITGLAPSYALPESFGPQKTIVMLVNFQNAPNNKPFTLEQVKNTYFNTVSNMYYEFSYRQTTVVGDAVGWFTVPINSSDSCSRITDQLPNYADAAARAAGVDLNQYRRKVYVFPDVPACSWGGLGSVGRWDNWSYAWINGSNSPYIVGHELGHNIGLRHSNLLACSGSVNTGNCSRITYGDYADIMGRGNTNHFNAYQKDRLGWLNYQSSPPIQTVTTSGNYTIAPYETFDRNTKALKIAKRILTNGSTDYYYLEYRQPIGFDTNLGTCTNCDFTKGILFHQGNSVNGDTSDILDMSPTDNNNTRMVALLPGKTFTDPSAPNGGVTFKLNSVSATGADVSVSFGSTPPPPPPPPSCVRANQTLTVWPNFTIYVTPGGSVTYTITVKNNDSTNCGSTTFNLTSEPPAGLSYVFTKPTLVIPPGGTDTSLFAVGSTFTTPPGIYQVPVKSTSASVPTNTATVNASFGVKLQAQIPIKKQK